MLLMHTLNIPICTNITLNTNFIYFGCVSCKLYLLLLLCQVSVDP